MRTLDLSQIGAVYIASGYSDLRRGINGLAAQVQQQFRLDPREQAVFLFCGRRSDRFKALFWDGDGFVLLYKRLEDGRYQWSRSREEEQQRTGQQSEGRLRILRKAVHAGTGICRDVTGGKTVGTQKTESSGAGSLPGMVQRCGCTKKFAAEQGHWLRHRTEAKATPHNNAPL